MMQDWATVVRQCIPSQKDAVRVCVCARAYGVVIRGDICMCVGAAKSLEELLLGIRCVVQM